MTPALSFVIPVRNDAARLARCLHSIAAQTAVVPIEIVVADNGSTDDSAAVARAAGATVLVLPGRPVSQLRNLAAAAAQGELLALVDADHELAPDWLAAATANMNDPAVWAVGAEYDAPADGTWVQRLYDRFRVHPPGITVTDWLPSGNLVVRRSVFQKVGGFDETLESCEDVDFCRRIRERGGVLLSAAALRSVHVGDPGTLQALFFSELWRGRDNIKVSLRERLTWRSAPSLIIPVVNVCALAAVAAGLCLAPWGFGRVAAVGATVCAASVLLRTARLWSRIPSADRHVMDLPRSLAVAGTYELARALALVVRAGHGVRRKA